MHSNRITEFLDDHNVSSRALARYKVSSSLEERLYPTTDANHNLTSIDDVFGAVKERLVYDPYRQSTVLSAAWATTADLLAWSTRSQGEREDATTNTIDGRSRLYGIGMGRWMQADFAGYIDGANRYQFSRSGPVSGNDPLGLFDTKYHKKITKEAVSEAKNFISSDYYNQLENANTGTDFMLFTITFLDAAHAQDSGWVRWLQTRMIRIVNSDDKNEVVYQMGKALHVLQDFYSHTDWVDGWNLVKLYQDPNHLMSDKFIGDALKHKPHPGLSGILDVERLYRGRSIKDLGNVFYFTGGYTRGLLGDDHDLYSADAPNKGRDAAFKQGKLGEGSSDPFDSAMTSAKDQSVAFLNWSIKNMKKCVRIELYGS